MMRRLLIAAFALLAAAPAWACVDRPTRPLAQLIADAHAIAIVRVEAEAMLAPDRDRVLLAPRVAATVRVVDTLQGDAAHLRAIEYVRAWCGGHELDTGAYYVAVVPSDAAVLQLEQNSDAVLRLGDEYSEADGQHASVSDLLLHLRNYVRIGRLPEHFDASAYTTQIGRSDMPTYSWRRGHR